MGASRLGAYWLFALAVIQGVTPQLANITGIGTSIEAQSHSVQFSPEVPADYAFGIWFVIFMLAMIFAVGQLLPRIRQQPLIQALRPLAMGVMLSNSMWMVTLQLFGDGWWQLLSIWAGWAFALRGLLCLVEYSMHDPADYKLKPFFASIVSPFFGLSAGWLTLAVWLNTASVIQASSFGYLGLTPTVFALLCLVTIVAKSATLFLQANGHRWYGVAVIWGILGVVAHNLFDEYHLSVAIFASVSVLLMSTLMAITPLSKLFKYVRRTRLKARRERTIYTQPLYGNTAMAWMPTISGSNGVRGSVE
jgi:hypothetical protein